MKCPIKHKMLCLRFSEVEFRAMVDGWGICPRPSSCDEIRPPVKPKKSAHLRDVRS